MADGRGSRDGRGPRGGHPGARQHHAVRGARSVGAVALSEALLRGDLLRGDKPPIVIAHRGASAAAPENTMAAFHAAFAAGALWIETDVQPTADNELVLIHDGDVARTTDGTGAIRDTALADAARLDAGSWFGSDRTFAGQRIPLLAELLAVVTGARRVLLEIKGDHTVEQLEIMLGQIHDAGCDARVFLQSFEVPVLRRLRRLRPRDPMGLLVETVHDDPIGVCRSLGATAYNPGFTELLQRPDVVRDLHAAGVATLPWTADSPADWAALTDLGVDGIITNRPAELLAWQAERHAG